MKTFILFILPALLFIGSCSPHVYKDKEFFSQAKLNEQTLAIMPVEVIYSGKFPKDWTAEYVAKLKEEQSIQLQEEIYEDFLFHASRKEIKKKWEVNLIDLHKLNDKLSQNGISLEESYRIPSDKLVDLLGVDMLVRGRVQNVRHMSQAAATGINIGVSVLEGILSKGGTSVYGGRARARDLEIDLSLYHSSKQEAVSRITRQEKLKIRNLPVYVKN